MTEPTYRLEPKAPAQPAGNIEPPMLGVLSGPTDDARLVRMRSWLSSMVKLAPDAPYWKNGRFAGDCVDAVNAIAMLMDERQRSSALVGKQLLVARVNVYAPIYCMEPRLIPVIDLETLPLGTHLLYALPKTYEALADETLGEDPAEAVSTGAAPSTEVAGEQAVQQDSGANYGAKFDQFIKWASSNLGQGYSLDCEDGTFTDPVTRWAHKAYCAGLGDATPGVTPDTAS